MAKVAINGLGRIGRATLKILMDTPTLELVAVNDLTPAANLAYLLKYDSVYGRYDRSVSVVESDRMIVGGREIRVLAEKDPALLPWAAMGVDLVFECTGRFTDKAGLDKHIKAGARHAILSTSAKGEEMVTVVYGVNQQQGVGQTSISCASCTTNCITPVVEIMGRRVGVEKAVLTTVHAYTSSQQLVDGPNKKPRRGRAGAINLVPTDTGAARATTKALPEFRGKFDGIAIRVPVASGSISDITFITKRPTSVKEITAVFREEASSDRYRGILAVADEPLVSSDILKDPHASIVDLDLIQVVDGNLVKIMSWYDNEWGYASQMVREALGLLAPAH